MTSSRREQLWSLLGRLPDRSAPVQGVTGQVTRTDFGFHEELTLDLNSLEPVPAYFVRPLTADGPVPVVLYHHAHGSRYTVGKEELLRGGPFLQSPPYVEELTRRGWAVLAIDAWNFGERHRRTESSLFKEMLWQGRVLWGMMIYDAVRSVDYLAARPDVDGTRIATLGMSMGSTLSWWLAALDERVKVCAEICCLTDYQALIEDGGLDRHGLYYYVPGLLEHFTAGDINALAAPRAHLSVVGIRDPLTPPAGVERINRQLKEVYSKAGAPEAWKLVKFDCAHVETPEIRAEVLQWLEDRL